MYLEDEPLDRHIPEEIRIHISRIERNGNYALVAIASRKLVGKQDISLQMFEMAKSNEWSKPTSLL